MSFDIGDPEGALGSRARKKAGVNDGSAIERESLSFSLPADPAARGVLVTDAQHRISSADSGIRKLLSLDGDEIIGLDSADFASLVADRFADPDEFSRRSRMLREDPRATVEDVMEMVAPRPRTLHRYSAPLLDESGNPAGRIEVYSDITRRKELEQTNERLYEQVTSAYRELRDTQAQLVQAEKLRAVGEIASGVAHDFNNTLGIILGNIQLLLRKTEDEGVRGRLRAIEQAALDAAETVRRIQEYTRAQRDEPLDLVDLSRLAESVIEAMKPTWDDPLQAAGRRINVETSVSDDALAAGIASEIREVLANVLLNSVDAMPNGGTIRVSTGRAGSRSWLKVEDTGAGMTEEVRGRVFDPFFTTKGSRGSGLGMSVAYGIVKRHGGKISVESEIRRGTAVTVFLQSASGDPARETKKRPRSEAVLPARILVVDDEEVFGRVFEEMLSECGHVVCVARSGSEAVRRFAESSFDLVFTDLGMPEMSGWEVARSIKELKPGTPVVLLTGWGARVAEDELSESNVDMVLSKPVRMEDLSLAISAVLAGRARNG